MKRFMSVVAAGALAFGSVAIVGVTAASAAQTTPTIKLTDPKAIIGLGAYTITVTTSVAGKVNFTAGGSLGSDGKTVTQGATISGCGAVATTTSSPFIATCSWTPAAAGPNYLGATLTPTDSTTYSSVSVTLLSQVGAPVQGNVGPIAIYVDTIVASGSTPGAYIGAGCSIQSEFYVGQQIVFRVYANDYDLNGAPLTSANVSTGNATVVIAGVATPLVLGYGNHSGAAFWTALLKTGTGAGLYSTLGIINYQVIFKTNAVPAVTKTVTATKYVATLKNGKKVYKNGKLVTHKVTYKKTVIVTPAVPGATATFQSNFNPLSQLTLNAVPAA